MADNQFSVDVPNPLQALLIGQKSYDAANDAMKARALDETRAQAAQAISSGDYNGGIRMLLGGGDMQGAQIAHGFLKTQLDQAHQAAADAESRRQFDLTYGLRKNADIRAQTEADMPGKPIPFETLSGTNFLVPQKGGTYQRLDPRTAGQPVPSSATVVGDAEGVAKGIYDAPSAPGQRPPLQGGQPAQPAADLTAIDPQTGRRENWLKAQDSGTQAYIKKIADYEIDPRTTSIKGGHREQVLSAVAQYDPTYDQNSFGSRAKAIKDFATGPQGNTIRSFDVAIDHLDTLKQYAKALDSGDNRLINEIRNRWLQNTGSPLPTNVQAIGPIVGAEVSKAIIGSNNALADREELRKPLQLSNSLPQIYGAIQGYQALMGGQLKGLKKQYEDTTGKKDFDKRIRDNTKKVLLSGESSQPVRVSTPQEASQLPPGTQIILPDGSPGVVPGG